MQLVEEISLYILYLDESGDPNSWTEQKCYVIAGVAVHIGKIDELSIQTDYTQKKYFPSIKIPIQFHATDIRRGKGQHFSKYDQNKRNEILKDVYALIGSCKFPDLIVFASIIDISRVENPQHARRTVFEDVCMKFNGFLLHQHRIKNPIKGLLVIDQNREAEYRELVNDFKRETTHGGYLGNVVDIPYFARCSQSRMLQLADFTANAFFRYYERDEDDFFKMILPRVYSGLPSWRYNKIYLGLGHYIARKEKCKCPTCHETDLRKERKRKMYKKKLSLNY
jgi:hypothetical protein